MLKLKALPASKGTTSIHYLGFSLLAPLCILFGTALAGGINWLYAALACLGALAVHTIAHSVHDLGHSDSSYQTLSPRGLKVLVGALAGVTVALVVYFTVAVSPWALAFAAVIPLVALYRRGLIYSTWSFSGGLAVCVLLGFFLQRLSLTAAPILVALFILLFAEGGIRLYKIDEWMKRHAGAEGTGVETYRIPGEDYSRAVGYLVVMVVSLVPLAIALFLV